MNSGVVSKVFDELVWQKVTNTTLALLFTRFPVLTIWPIKPILTAFARHFSNKLFEILDYHIDLTRIRLKNLNDEKKFKEAIIHLYVIGVSKGVESDVFKTQLTEVKRRFSDVVSFNRM